MGDNGSHTKMQGSGLVGVLGPLQYIHKTKHGPSTGDEHVNEHTSCEGRMININGTSSVVVSYACPWGTAQG